MASLGKKKQVLSKEMLICCWLFDKDTVKNQSYYSSGHYQQDKLYRLRQLYWLYYMIVAYINIFPKSTPGPLIVNPTWLLFNHVPQVPNLLKAMLLPLAPGRPLMKICPYEVGRCWNRRGPVGADDEELVPSRTFQIVNSSYLMSNSSSLGSY